MGRGKVDGVWGGLEGAGEVGEGAVVEDGGAGDLLDGHEEGVVGGEGSEGINGVNKGVSVA